LITLKKGSFDCFSINTRTHLKNREVAKSKGELE
jgi:hypothetical protein